MLVVIELCVKLGCWIRQLHQREVLYVTVSTQYGAHMPDNRSREYEAQMVKRKNPNPCWTKPVEDSPAANGGGLNYSSVH